MVPTFLTNLALGTITTMVASIMSLSSWIAGSQILQGNLFFDTTNNATPGIYVDTQLALSPTAGGLNFNTNGTQSGVVVKDNGVTALATYTVTCTATGGLAKYDTCIIPPLLSTTGAVARIDLMTATSPVGTAGFDCGFVKARNTGTGTAFTNLGNKAFATGSIVTYSTGSLRWNSADFIKCGTLTAVTSSFSAKLRVVYFDDTSE